MRKICPCSTTLCLALLLVISELFASNIEESAAPPGFIFELLTLNRDLPTPRTPKYRSPTDLVPSPDGKSIFICEQTAKRIAVFDVPTGSVVKHIILPNEVTGCAVAPDGTLLYATCASDLWPNGMVCIVNVAAGKVIGRIAVGHGARAPVITPDGTKLFVCNQFNNDVSVVDLAAQQETARIESVREPYCAAITPDGKTLVVGNLLPGDRSTDTSFIACKISLIDVATNTVSADVRLRRGSHSVLGVAVSPDGKFAFATHLIGNFNMIGTTVEKGWLHTDNLAVIDISGKKLINDVCLDGETAGAGNPWGVRCTDNGEFLVVAHAGSNELSIINLPEMIDSVVARTAAGVDMRRDFTSMLDSRQRVGVNVKGPRALAVVGSSVFTAGYFDDSAAVMEKFEISLSTTQAAATYLIGEPQPPTGERRGESYFYDATLAFQKWHSCSSCHPFGRTDGLNWILGGGTITAPKNTKGLVYSWWTPPMMWDGGHRGDMQTSIAFSVELELFRTPTTSITSPLDTFFMNIKPVPSPNLRKGKLSEAAQRGKVIYCNREKADCIICHPGPLFTDKKLWNAGVPDDYGVTIQWATPSRIEAWRTGPYGHLGGFWNVREICELPGHSRASSKLTDEEMDDLMAYVLSL